LDQRLQAGLGAHHGGGRAGGVGRGRSLVVLWGVVGDGIGGVRAAGYPSAARSLRPGSRRSSLGADRSQELGRSLRTLRGVARSRRENAGPAAVASLGTRSEKSAALVVHHWPRLARENARQGARSRIISHSQGE